MVTKQFRHLCDYKKSQNLHVEHVYHHQSICKSDVKCRVQHTLPAIAEKQIHNTQNSMDALHIDLKTGPVETYTGLQETV